MIKCAAVLWRLALTALLGVMVWGAVFLPDFLERQIQREMGATRSDAMLAIDTTRRELLHEVANLRRDVMHQADATRSESLAAISAIAAVADARLADTTGKLDAQLTATRADLQPVLANAVQLTGNAAALTKDAQNSLDDLYWDVKASVESATVTMHSIAEASASIEKTAQSVQAAVPPVLANMELLSRQSAGIATDVHTFTTAATAPVPWYKKVGSILYGGAMLASRLK